jgi:hypothetical protein
LLRSFVMLRDEMQYFVFSYFCCLLTSIKSLKNKINKEVRRSITVITTWPAIKEHRHGDL